MSHSRRSFLRTAGAVSLGFTGLQHFVCGMSQTYAAEASLGYGKLLDDPEGVLRLPAGFNYHAFSHVGEPMDDGFLVPGNTTGWPLSKVRKGKRSS